MRGARVLGACLAALVLAGLVLMAKAGLDRLPARPWGNPAGGSLSAEIAGRAQVGQTFRAPLPGLNGIEVVFEGTVAASSDDGEGTPAPRITLHLRTRPTDTVDLRSSDLDVSKVHPGIPHRFAFEAVPDSKGRSYYFYLESPSSKPGNALKVQYGPTAVLEEASAYFDGVPATGNLVFRTFYSLRTRDKLDLLLTRMAEGRPYFLGSKGFYMILAAVYLVCLGWFLWVVAKAVLEESG